ncbi:MAG: LLM class flavin-dependent oxidoreductase [Gammaproteobacteria bacterium]|nr:LLM class flavin-dependent oxidoreductase [Gammaproteobacteria bacterium]
MEFWTTAVGLPGDVAEAAKKAEAQGWDGLGIPYAPLQAPDPYCCMTAAALATSTIKLGNWVATPASHTPASAAGSIKTVQAVSEGRAVFGLGRGDSALAYLGMSPAPLKFFEAYVQRVRNYLQEEAQPFDLDLDGVNHFPSVERLGLAQSAEEARFSLFMEGIDPVPLDMVGTGPKVLAIAARYADRITTAVGADPERVGWALDVVRQEREAGNVDRPVSLGAWVPVAVTDDIEAGRRMLSGVTASMARFTAMHGKSVAPVSEGERKVYESVHDAYQLRAHFQEGSPQSKEVPADFYDRFAIIGPADECIERLNALVDLGIERFVVASPSPLTTPDLADKALALFTNEVMPTVRAAEAN